MLTQSFRLVRKSHEELMKENTSPYDNLLLRLPSFPDGRGLLTLCTLGQGGGLPFDVQRLFWITNVPPGAQRGSHSHRTCWELLVAVSGSFRVKVDNGSLPPVTFTLSSETEGLLIPPLYWCELSAFTADAVCLCLASGNYDREGYINDYETFRRIAAENV